MTQAIGGHWTLFNVDRSGSVGAGWTPSFMVSATSGIGHIKFFNHTSIEQPKSNLQKILSLRKFLTGL